jgi:hypothetical protein
MKIYSAQGKSLKSPGNIILLIFFIFSGLFFPFENADAQDNTLYLMPVIPQANQLNPAWMTPCRTYVELPVISSVKLNIRNTAFGFHDVIHTGTGTNSGIYYFDWTEFARKLQRNNFFTINTDIDLLGAGFSYKSWYITFGIANHSEVIVQYPHDLASLKDGNWQVASGTPVPVNLSGLGINVTIWNSIGISAAKELREGLRVGVRAKYLQGMANLNTRRSNFELNTFSNPIILAAEAQYRINASFPVTLGYAANGLVNKLDFSNSMNNIVGNYIFNGNRGLAFDAGIVYDLDEKTQLSASFTDLGFIWWRKNVNNFTGSANSTFSGLDLNQLLVNPGQVNLIRAIQDSIKKSFYASGSKRGYVTLTSTKVFGGITYELAEGLKAGAMTRLDIYSLHVRPSLTLSMNYIPFPVLAATLSYTIMNNKFNQVGAGLALGNRGAQFYLLTDNIPVRFTRSANSSLIWPYNARMISIRFGLNLLFNCNKKDTHPHSGKQKSSDYCPAYR